MSRVTSEEFAARLKSSGKWDEFKAMRQARLDSGMSKKQAYDETASDYGINEMVPEGVGVEVREERAVSKDIFVGKSGSVRSDFEWVYRNQAITDVVPEDAPSSGAWGLLQFARSDPRSFYVKWMDVVSRSEDRDAVIEGFKQDARRATSEIAEMLSDFRSVLPDSSEGLRGELGVPELVADEVG